MKRALLLFSLFAGPGLAFAADAPALAPAKNVVWPMFTRQNFRSMTVRGSEARASLDNTLRITDLNLTVFSGDAANRVESVLLSPDARFVAKTETAQGEKGVRLIRDDLEAIGTQWIYRRAEKKVSLQGNVRIIFNAELHSILK